MYLCRYLENIPAIVPLLEKEYRNAAAQLEATQNELNELQPDKLKERGRVFRCVVGRLSVLEMMMNWK